MPGSFYDVVYFCDWLPPDFGAVGQYSSIFTQDMANSGQSVVLIGLTSGEPSIQVSNGSVAGGELRIHRIKARKPDKNQFFKRLIWTIFTNTRLLAAGWRYIKKSKTVYITGSPPLFLHWIMMFRFLYRGEIVYRITDFHPECTIAERGQANLFLRLVLAVTLFWRRRVDRFEVLGRDQEQRLREIGIAPERISLKRDPSPVKISADIAPLVRPQEYQGRKLILYSGNWGLAHDVDTFVEGYARHHHNGSRSVILWLNAIGANADRVEKILRDRNLPVHRSHPLALDHLPALLITPDAHLITLSDAFVGYVLPSKVYGCVASGKPTLFIGSAHSDVHLVGSEGLGKAYIRADIGSYDEVSAFLEMIAAGAFGSPKVRSRSSFPEKIPSENLNT